MNTFDASMSLATPALLFPAISLLMLAYTNRFFALTQVIRQLHPEAGPVSDLVLRQIVGLRYRVKLIQSMQVCGVFSFLLCSLSMLALFFDQRFAGHLLFGLSLTLLCVSLLLSLVEVLVSTNALNVVLEDIEHQPHASALGASRRVRRDETDGTPPSP